MKKDWQIIHVIGARPNFMKVAPVVRALDACSSIRQILVHTGQHYDFSMSDIFFQELGIRPPDFNLRVGSASHARQTADIMTRLEPVLLEQKPRLVLVYGDVNSTLAAALVCSKLGIPVGHVEAGLRSFDRSMPEEVNRLLTDQLADFLFTPSQDGNHNLAREGIPGCKIHLVGNVMIDTLLRMLPKAQEQVPVGLPERYLLVTLHRPSNVDDLPWLAGMIRTLEAVAKRTPVLFPVHPRTQQRLAEAGIAHYRNNGVRLMEPLPYIEFLALQTRAAAVITDSGGIQEETTFLGIPCLTLRENTERPVTVALGTNLLVGRDLDRLGACTQKILEGQHKAGQVPPLWDGHAAERIARIIIQSYDDN